MYRAAHPIPASHEISGVLWDLFSGSAPYTNVFLRTLSPAYIASLVRNLVTANLPERGRDSAAQTGRQGT